ncbi:MAG: hypothetical protein RJQ00_07265 [Vicingaceae bacterium]
MPISLKTHKILWGKSGNRCAFPECRIELVVDESLTDDPSIIGQEAHIVARSPDGPRGDNEMNNGERDKYSNLILLCGNHHKIIDDQQEEYTIKKLQKFKSKHEEWVSNNLNLDEEKLKDEKLYASYIDKFIEFTDLHNWTNWTSYILGVTMEFPKDNFDMLMKTPDYIVSRVWPGRYEELEASLINFKNVINDLVMVYYMHPLEKPNAYAIERFYKNFQREMFYRDEDSYDQQKEIDAVNRYDYHLALIIDLVVELTRALNYVCDKIRKYLFEGFRIDEGVILISRFDWMSNQTYRVEYRGLERTQYPYTGLKNFMKEREKRDYYIGTGVNEDYFARLPWE